MTLETLKQQQTKAIQAENYELAGKLKAKIEAWNPTNKAFQSQEPKIGEIEKLYQENHEVFDNSNGAHDTTSKSWEYEGTVSKIKTIRNDIFGAFPHEVDKVQLNNPATGKPSNHWCLVHDGQELPVSVKKGYVPHTRDDVATLCEAAQEAFGGKVKIATTFRNGHFVSIQPTDSYRRSVFGTDTINPRLIIQAHCGGGSFKASLGWYRDVCRNLTWLRSVAVVSESIQHSSKLAAQHANLVDTFSIVAKGWESTGDFLAQMEQRQVRVNVLLAELMGTRPEDAGRGQTMFDKKIVAIDSILIRERMKLGKAARPAMEATAWELFNAIQGYSQHQKSRKGKPTDTMRAVIANNDPEVLKAERLLFADELQPQLTLV